MNVIPSFAPVGEGAVSTIIRDEQGVTITVHTRDLGPGPDTVWLLIWNHPENCNAAVTGFNCLPPPVGGPDAPDSVLFGAGALVGDSGRGDFGLRLNVGDTSNVRGGAVQAGLTDALGAELHVIIADHGELMPDIIREQLTTPDAGCGGPCPFVQGAAHSPGAPNEITLRLQAIKELLNRVAARNGLRP